MVIFTPHSIVPFSSGITHWKALCATMPIPPVLLHKLAFHINDAKDKLKAPVSNISKVFIFSLTKLNLSLAYLFHVLFLIALAPMGYILCTSTGIHLQAKKFQLELGSSPRYLLWLFNERNPKGCSTVCLIHPQGAWPSYCWDHGYRRFRSRNQPSVLDEQIRGNLIPLEAGASSGLWDSCCCRLVSHTRFWIVFHFIGIESRR